MSRVIRVLTIDGGGVRGLVPAQLLVQLERQLQEASGRSGARISDFFDFFAGTSTGGVLTCLQLTPSLDDNRRARYGAEDVVRIYEECSARVFRSSLWGRLRSGGGFLHKKFDATGIEEAFREFFGDTWLRDLIRPCLVPAYDIERGKAHFFTQHDARTRPGHDFLVRDVARATSAAPTIFEVAFAKNELDGAFPLIDGGVFANNPALCAFAEVCNMFEHAGARDIVMLSLGTGIVPTQLKYETVKDYGIARWMGPLADIMVASASETVDYQLQKIFAASHCEDQYLRINPRLISGQLPNSEIDDASTENVAALKRFGEEAALSHRDALDALVKKLIHPEVPERRRRSYFPLRLLAPIRAAMSAR